MLAGKRAICSEIAPKNGNSLQWIEAEAAQTGLQTASVDCVLSLEARCHFPDRQLFLAEAARILRPGGALVCSDILFGPCKTESATACLTVVTNGYAPWPNPQATVADHAVKGLNLRETRDTAAHTDATWDHIVSSQMTPLASPEAAMRTLHRAGLMKYVMSVLDKPVE